MSFESPTDFLAMGGHALYVWLSYGAALLVVIYNVTSVRRARRRHIRLATDRLRRASAAGDVGTVEAEPAPTERQSESGNP